MRKLVFVLTFAAFSVPAFAGIFRSSAKVVAGSARLGAKASAKSAKVAFYPVRHPVNSVKKSAKAAKAVAY